LNSRKCFRTVDEEKEYFAQYRLDNSEKLRQYRLDNRDKNIEYQRNYRLNNKN